MSDPISVAIAYHSGYGHTARQAAAVAAGADSVPTARAVLLDVTTLDGALWATLDAAEAIIFGSPTYMGGTSATFQAFAEASSAIWADGGWQDKLAAGFTNSAGTQRRQAQHAHLDGAVRGPARDELGDARAAAGLVVPQHRLRTDLNRLGGFLGAMAQSPSDLGPDLGAARSGPAYRRAPGQAGGRDRRPAGARHGACSLRVLPDGRRGLEDLIGIDSRTDRAGTVRRGAVDGGAGRGGVGRGRAGLVRRAHPRTRRDHGAGRGPRGGNQPRPFAVNLWVPQPGRTDPAVTGANSPRTSNGSAPYLDELGLPEPDAAAPFGPSFPAQAEALLAAAPPVMSFVMGIPPGGVIAEARRRGIVTIGTATTVDEAVAIEAAGIDAVVASGSDAGGHRGAFLRPVDESLVGTFALGPAGGRRGVDAGDRGRRHRRRPRVAAAFTLGADGVQIGTGFLATAESGASAGPQGGAARAGREARPC